MSITNLLKSIDSKWTREFVRFIETGEANAGFLDYLDHDKGCQEAVEKAFMEQAAALEDLARALKRAEKVPAA